MASKENMNPGLRVTFCGGAETVTGSNFLVENDASKILIDCGLEQGSDFSVEAMYGPFPYDPSTVDALVVTHAHLDHIGRIPKLVKEGFRGKIYMTPPTRDLAALILADSVDILAAEARRLNREPLYGTEDLAHALSLIEPIDYHVEKEIAGGLSIYLRNTGHILGSASVRIQAQDVSMAFTGDIGNSPSPYLPDPEPIPDADVILMESVYGDRLHDNRDDRTKLLLEALRRAVQKGGAMLMPAFSMERTQLMLYELSNMFSAKQLEHFPVFLDSPLAINVTEVYKKYAKEYFKLDVQDELAKEGDIFNFPFLTKTKDREDAVEIEKAPNPKLIMAGAGMSHGGRIGRWEQKYLGDPKTTLFIVGYQAPGSPGRLLQEGAPKVRLDGKDVVVHAKVESLSAWSAHADRDELLAFAQAALPRTKNFFVALGEPSAARFLAQRIRDYLGIRATVPTTGEVWQVTKDSITRQ